MQQYSAQKIIETRCNLKEHSFSNSSKKYFCLQNAHRQNGNQIILYHYSKLFEEIANAEFLQENAHFYDLNYTIISEY